MSTRTLGVGLFISLALNLFLVGAIVGGVLIGHRLRGAGPGPGGAAQPLWAAASVLPADKAEAYRLALRDQARDVGRQVRQARRERRDAWMALAESPLDAAGVTRRLAQARAIEMQARGGVEERIVAFAAGLSAADRAELAQALARSGPGRRMGLNRPPGPERDRPDDGPEGSARPPPGP